MIQDIAPYTFYNTYRDIRPTKDSTVFFFSGQEVLADISEDRLRFPTYGQLTSEPATCIYLFSIDDQSFFLALDRPDPGLAGYKLENTQMFRTIGPRHLAYAGLTAHQLYKWYRNNVYCGRCGGNLVHSKEERMLHCPECGNMLYPKISPVVIIGVTDGDRLLLIKHANGTRNYALVAGFAEVGESIEQTVAREVMEETGLKVKNPRFYKSQPWALSESLLFGFYVELDGPQEPQVDMKEVVEATFFKREDIPVEPKNFALTNEMIIHFKNGGALPK
jgi:NAD+ diphosphatase